jgi:hypothetical protein
MAGIIRNYDEKYVTSQQASQYIPFGWVRMRNAAVPEEQAGKGKKMRDTVLRRKLPYGADIDLVNCEAEYEKCAKKKYRSKPILGIISFILMIAFLFVAGVELYFGITKGLDALKAKPAEAENTAEATADKPSQIETILNKIQTDYLSKATDLFDGKTDAAGVYTEGVADKLAASAGGKAEAFINAFDIVGLIGLILGIVFLIVFCEVCKLKKKRLANMAKMDDCQDRAKEIVGRMRRSDFSLLNRYERKQFILENAITNALRAYGHGDGDNDSGEDF